MLVSDSKHEPYTAPPTNDGLPPPYVADEAPSDEVPSYSAGPSVSTQTTSFVPAPDIHPCNHLLQSEADTILAGSYLLDVSLPAPPLAASMPSFRKLGDANMRFEVRDGSIEPRIWIAALKEKAPPQTRARIAVKIRDGKTNIILHSPHPSMPRPRISLSVEVRDGRNAIFVPRSFRGNMTIKKRHGVAALSSSVRTVASLLYSANGEQVYSFGERDLDPELADEIKFDGRDGGVSIMFDDEAPPPSRK